MKKIILLILLSIIVTRTKAQVVETGAGYFTDLFGFNIKDLGAQSDNRPGMPGFITWGEVGFNLKRNFTASVFIGNGKIKHGTTKALYPLVTNLYTGGNVNSTYFIIDLNFKKKINLIKKNNYWHFNPGLGVFYRRLSNPTVMANFVPAGNGKYYIKNIYIDDWKDNVLGLSVNMDFSFGKKFFYFGIRAKSFIAMYYGLEGLMITPYFGINIPKQSKPKKTKK